VAYPYITKADLESRIGADTVRAIFDEDRDGDADDDKVTRLLKDASAKVAGYLRGIYPLATIAANPPEEVLRLTLDVAEAYAAKRHSEYVQRDWEKLMLAAERDLKSLRRGETRLDVDGSPEPAANQGGLTVEVPAQLFTDDSDF